MISGDWVSTIGKVLQRDFHEAELFAYMQMIYAK